MQIAFKTSIMAAEEVLPYKHELEYIGATGTQYINTGLQIVNNVGYQIECEAKWWTKPYRSYDNLGVLFGIWNTSPSTRSYLINTDGNSITGVAGPDNSTYYGAIPFDTAFHVYSLKNEGVFVDGERKCDTALSQLPDMPSGATSIPLFKPVFSNSFTDAGGLRFIKYFKMWSVAGVLLRHFIPVVDNNDVICMYDKVTKQLFYNAGTGDFIYEPTTAMTYDYDGLVLNLNGIENSGFGSHTDNTTTWANLGVEGSRWTTSRSSGVFSSTGAEFARSGSNASFFRSLEYLQCDFLKGEWTVECIFTPQSGWFNHYSGIFGQHRNGTIGICGGQYYQGNICFDLWGTVLYDTPPSNWTLGQTYSIVIAASATNGTFKVYRNNIEVAAGSATSAALTLTDTEFYVGVAYPGSDRVFSGTIHALRAYTSCRSAEQISANYAIDKKQFTSLP